MGYRSAGPLAAQTCGTTPSRACLARRWTVEEIFDPQLLDT
jgi:hypothetical protein